MYVPVGIRIKLTVRIPVLQDLVELEGDGWTFGLCGWLATLVPREQTAIVPPFVLCLPIAYASDVLSLKRILVKPILPGCVT